VRLRAVQAALFVRAIVLTWQPVASSSHATHRVAGSGRRQQARYPPVPLVIVLHVQQHNARSAWRR
jgi:hypothetical protein